jgi:hypothetical protein
MFYWHSATIAEAFGRITDVYKVINQGPGGDCDSDNLVVYLRGCGDKLFVSGFNTPEQPDITTPGACDVEMIELTDGRDDRGGLTSTIPAVAMAYTRVRQFFIDKGATVVPTHKDYW